ncbi:GNAT family N-acetyltransferase [Antrihabitans sp. YC2-6]|uniref:GNAT family N-acetyltransferase n=1 Tax=Antrihabitans sp. YC2-6 TaxID=2799498 RepID=UPI0018F716D3|nr:GNAT family N-acetyltransferase [Antrihabitans sp. YC2-6]MBJ8343154.1 GNAT family N-acetyltransferase [Antrihabitans sp. YC2-6]
MTTLDGITFRPGTPADWPDLIQHFAFCFGHTATEANQLSWRSIIDEKRILIALDDGAIVGQTTDISLTLTVPGGNQVPAAGITAVCVSPTHRRRGLLRALYTEQHRRIQSTGVPLALLTASEGGIYGRFGYGPATIACGIQLDRRLARFHDAVPDPGGVTIPRIGDAATSIPRIYDRWQALVPGAQVRPPAMWDLVFAGRNKHGDDRPVLYSLVHRDGYALFTRTTGEPTDSIRVHELRTVTDDAHIALWRVLLGMDLVGRVDAHVREDDALPYLLADGRQVETKERADGLWVRIMDIPAALEAREYAVDFDTVIEVRDPFLDAGGNFALSIRDRKATCIRTDATAQLSMDIDVLGSLYLGAHRAAPFAKAHRLWGKDLETIRMFDIAFETDRESEMGWGF